ncbi:cation diffusion facilitator family [Micromonas pusilla CCMP1545]|uniref:Cation diffusion facilitator family n=1 Tax=Micromonas pusilla (strain CCMP1545) TaxID=564608 RepID=C1N4S3_MICPC|nr:cation diffusion facilitator family [Micromonas pusilla CCMP1545]EEH52781.1 cation diffusion facilitator family [Micromonas pusilla CCMP1545]|eukprot:XP_003062842.1 cation diffusion facilitator family [Micromonas pusilla CCMP1545]
MSSSGSLRALAVETTADETTVVLPPSSVPGASSSRSKNLRDGNMSFRKSPDSWRLSADAFDTHKKTAEEFQGLRSRKAKSGVMAYYRKQNALVDQFGEIETLIAATDATGAPILASDEDAAEKTRGDAKREKREEFALQISFWANVLLLGIKTYAAVVSGSLSIMTSALDSFLDLVSGLILYLTERNMKKSNKYMYPAGKSRMQPLGIIVFSCIMGTLGFQIMIEGVRQLVGETHTHHLEDLWAVLGIMVSVIVVKFCLYLFCRNSQNEAVLTYAQDHRNDVMTNSVGLAAAIAGDKLYFWIDPLGAILLASYIVYNWSCTALENVKAMVGVSAPPEFLTQLTYLAWNHHEDIVCIDTVRAYTFGPNYFVEVDVVLPEEMPLRRAHDIGESLQNRIEEMEDVERAFVHIDFETAHYPEHAEATRADRERRRAAARATAISPG